MNYQTTFNNLPFKRIRLFKDSLFVDLKGKEVPKELSEYDVYATDNKEEIPEGSHIVGYQNNLTFYTVTKVAEAVQDPRQLDSLENRIANLEIFSKEKKTDYIGEKNLDDSSKSDRNYIQ